MKVTQLGSMILYRHIKELVAEKHNYKLQNNGLAHLLGLYPADITAWKQGKRIIKDVASYRELAKLAQVDVDRLIDIATETDLEMVSALVLQSARLGLMTANGKTVNAFREPTA